MCIFYDFDMISIWFRYDFVMISLWQILWFSYGFGLSLIFRYDFVMVSGGCRLRGLICFAVCSAGSCLWMGIRSNQWEHWAFGGGSFPLEPYLVNDVSVFKLWLRQKNFLTVWAEFHLLLEFGAEQSHSNELGSGFWKNRNLLSSICLACYPRSAQCRP